MMYVKKKLWLRKLVTYCVNPGNRQALNTGLYNRMDWVIVAPCPRNQALRVLQMGKWLEQPVTQPSYFINKDIQAPVR